MSEALRNDSLLVALSSYRPRKNRRSIEDFITEAFCWLLRNNGMAEQAVLQQLSAKLEQVGDGAHSFVDEEVGWSTQQRLRNSRPDMILETDETVFVFEHKVWDETSAGQLRRHRGGAENRYARNVCVVLITAASWLANEEADICLTWGRIFALLEQVQHEEDRQFLMLNEFLTLLDNEGLGPTEHISESGIRAYRPAQQFQSRLRTLLRQIPHSRDDWSFVYDQLPTDDQSREPEFNRNQRGIPLEGRLGYKFRDWTPNVFVGVILDGDDHCHELSPLGPDVVAVLDLARKKKIGGQSRDEFLRSDKYRELSDYLKAQTVNSDWDVRDTYHDPGSMGCNKWHPLIVHQPLLQILRGTETIEEQRMELHQAMANGARLMLEDGTLASLFT